MELERIGVKFYVEPEADLKLKEFIPIFHRWIRERALGILLVDVADYTHLDRGPGIALIGHQADFTLDSMIGPVGLFYSRKAPLSGSARERILTAFREALSACVKLEEEPEFRGRLRFRGSEALFLLSDRLHAPNTQETFQSVKLDLEQALAQIYAGAPVGVRHVVEDPRDRFMVHIRAQGSVGVGALLERARGR